MILIIIFENYIKATEIIFFNVIHGSERNPFLRSEEGKRGQMAKFGKRNRSFSCDNGFLIELDSTEERGPEGC